jgi:hypothetical protein
MDVAWAPRVASVIETIYQIVPDGLDSVTANPSSFALPNIPSQNAVAICHAAASIFETETLFVRVEGDFVLVGDLHGHVLDLLRVFVQFGLPPSTKYIFLGDYVDRGDFSIHTTLYLLALKCRYPRSVYLLRGNHEFEDVNKIAGLFAEVREEYHAPDVYVALNRAFAYLPLAIRLNDDVLCLHGGIGPKFVSLEQLKTLCPPITTSTDPIVESIVWSDPNPDVLEFQANRKRNRGSEFGERPLTDFLSRHQLRTLIRGHSFVPEGVRFAFNNQLVTVSSASNHCEGTRGLCGVLVITRGAPMGVHQLAALPEVTKRPSAQSIAPRIRRIPAKDLDTTPRGVSPGGKGPPIVISRPYKLRAVGKSSRSSLPIGGGA